MPSTDRFCLYTNKPDISPIQDMTNCIGLGIIPLPLTEEFSLDSPNLFEVDQDIFPVRHALQVGDATLLKLEKCTYHAFGL